MTNRFIEPSHILIVLTQIVHFDSANKYKYREMRKGWVEVLAVWEFSRIF